MQDQCLESLPYNSFLKIVLYPFDNVDMDQVYL